MHTAGAIILAILIFLILGAVGWIFFTRWRAQRLGLPPPAWSSYIPFRKSSQTYGPPQPRRGGVVGWFNDRIEDLKRRNNRTAGGSYEEPLASGASRGRRGFGPLDPDEAWDARVGAEADAYGPYGETELGLHHPSHAEEDTSYGGSYPMNLASNPGAGGPDEERPRGRSATRPTSHNPFDDDAEPSNISLRGVSPRPIDTHVAASRTVAKDGDSPTERRSIFTENV